MALLDFLRKKHAQLVFPNGHIELYENKIMIGRGKTKNKFLEKIDGKLVISPENCSGKGISRKHGTFQWDPMRKKYTYRDHSRNGTIINHRLYHNQKVNLNHKDTFFFPGLKIEILYPHH